VPEIVIWNILECLASGLCVMAHGNAEVDGPVWKELGIVHFDLKPDNGKSVDSLKIISCRNTDCIQVLISQRSGGHLKFEIFKVRANINSNVRPGAETIIR
jgi:hypothetical protein